jgi:hypothetical protein
MKLKKPINNVHDKSYKDLYSNKEVFLDLIQGMLKAPWAKNLKAEDLTLIKAAPKVPNRILLQIMKNKSQI